MIYVAFRSMDKDTLIEMVRDVPMLWDTRHKNYKNVAFKKIEWEKIGTALNKTGKFERLVRII